jgi:predicted dehydrogenase
VSDAADLRVAVIGFGLAGSVFHAPLIAATPGLELTTVVTGNLARRDEARARYPAVRVEPDADALFARAGEHDVVVVASPNETHVELASRAIELGLVTVVDKPLATSAVAAAELVRMAEGREVALTVFQNRRWDSDQLTLRRLLDDGALGLVHRYESRFERWRPRDAEVDPADRRPGRGVVLDLLTHLVDQALVLFGPARAAHGEAGEGRELAAEADAFVAIEHESGTRSHLWASTIAAAPGPRLRVLGGRAAYVVDGLDGQEHALASGLAPEPGRPWGAEPEDRWGRLVRGDVAEPVPPEPGDWPRFYALLARSLRGDGPPPVNPRDAVAVLELLERALGPP